MFAFKHQKKPHDTPQAQACGLAPNSTKLELNNPKARPRSLIDKLANINGDLWSDGDIQIDGHLCGNLNCAQLIVGKDAVVVGAIIAEEAVIRGKMTGLSVQRACFCRRARAWKAKSSINHCRWTKAPASKVSRARVQTPSPRTSQLRPWPHCDGAGQRARLACRRSEDCGASNQPTGNLEATPEPLRSIEHSVAERGFLRPAADARRRVGW